MMYTNKLSACIKVNGKVLREDGDKVYIPYGAEYTISIKNHNTLRAAVNIEIDGVDATDQHDLIINANSTVEFTRFIKNGNLTSGNAFKFIERTSSIEQFRGIKQDDGLVRIKFAFERPSENWPYLYNKSIGLGQHTFGGITRGYSGQDDVIGMSLKSASAQPNLMNQAYATSLTQSNTHDPYNPYDPTSRYEDYYSAKVASASNTEINSLSSTTNVVRARSDLGITVPGSVQNQQFSVVTGFNRDSTEYVLIIQLRGETTAGVQIAAPITVKAKPKCTTCGKVNKATSKFCANCGTSLTLV